MDISGTGQQPYVIHSPRRQLVVEVQLQNRLATIPASRCTTTMQPSLLQSQHTGELYVGVEFSCAQLLSEVQMKLHAARYT